MLAFPAVLLPRTGIFTVQSEAELRRWPAWLFWRGGIAEGLKVIDANGRSFMLRFDQVVRPQSKFGQWLARILDRSVEVTYSASEIETVTPRQLASLVSAAIEEDPFAYEEAADADPTTARRRLESCSTIQEVVAVLNGMVDG